MTLDDLRVLLRLDDGSRRVLVVEDATGHHAAMLRWLGREGHRATGFGTVDDVEGGLLTGRDLYGEPLAFPMTEFDVAFLDFYFPEEPWNGGRLARALIAANPRVRIFGMSSVAGKNAEMTRRGAIGGMLKRDLAALIG